jgi:hypothetical protein
MRGKAEGGTAVKVAAHPFQRISDQARRHADRGDLSDTTEDQAGIRTSNTDQTESLAREPRQSELGRPPNGTFFLEEFG